VCSANIAPSLLLLSAYEMQAQTSHSRGEAFASFLRTRVIQACALRGVLREFPLEVPGHACWDRESPAGMRGRKKS